MTPQEYEKLIHKKQAKMDALQAEHARIRHELREAAKAYAKEHVAESGYVPGEKYMIEYFPGIKREGFFSHAEASEYRPDGRLTLYFLKPKKDGTASKVIDHSLTQHFTPKG